MSMRARGMYTHSNARACVSLHVCRNVHACMDTVTDRWTDGRTGAHLLLVHVRQLLVLAQLLVELRVELHVGRCAAAIERRAAAVVELHLARVGQPALAAQQLELRVERSVALVARPALAAAQQLVEQRLARVARCALTAAELIELHVALPALQ